MSDPLEGLPDQAHDFLEDELDGGVVIATINGIVADYDPPGGIDSCETILIDPTPQRWLPGHLYSNAGDGNEALSLGAIVVNANGVRFIAQEAGSGLTGGVEPAFAPGGGPYENDGDFTWSEQGVYKGGWEPLTDYDALDVIFESGSAWMSDGGTSATERPDFSDTTISAFVVDGSINWQNAGPSGIWAPETRFSFRASPNPADGYGQPIIVASSAAPGDPAWSGQPAQVKGLSGATEPPWDDAVEGDSSAYVDHELIWNETGAEVVTVLTGIVAPASLARVAIGKVNTTSMVTLEDAYSVPDEYPLYASQDANAFDALESNVPLNRNLLFDLVYVGDRWRVFYQ